MNNSWLKSMLVIISHGLGRLMGQVLVAWRKVELLESTTRFAIENCGRNGQPVEVGVLVNLGEWLLRSLTF